MPPTIVLRQILDGSVDYNACPHSKQLLEHDPGPNVTSWQHRCPRCLRMIQFERKM